MYFGGNCWTGEPQEGVLPMPTPRVERRMVKRPVYNVGVKRGGSPWHRLAQVTNLELALDLIHDDATRLGRPNRPELLELRCGAQVAPTLCMLRR
jgi:hypothetical protein